MVTSKLSSYFLEMEAVTATPCCSTVCVTLIQGPVSVKGHTLLDWITSYVDQVSYHIDRDLSVLGSYPVRLDLKKSVDNLGYWIDRYLSVTPCQAG